MDCKEFEQMISLYLHDELNEKELKELKKHLVTCEACKEELTIQYLITEGMHRLEEGNTLDVEKELQEKMDRAMHQMVTRKRFHITYIAMRIVLVIIILVSVFNFLT